MTYIHTYTLIHSDIDWCTMHHHSLVYYFRKSMPWCHFWGLTSSSHSCIYRYWYILIHHHTLVLKVCAIMPSLRSYAIIRCGTQLQSFRRVLHLLTEVAHGLRMQRALPSQNAGCTEACLQVLLVCILVCIYIYILHTYIHILQYIMYVISCNAEEYVILFMCWYYVCMYVCMCVIWYLHLLCSRICYAALYDAANYIALESFPSWLCMYVCMYVCKLHNCCSCIAERYVMLPCVVHQGREEISTVVTHVCMHACTW